MTRPVSASKQQARMDSVPPSTHTTSFFFVVLVETRGVVVSEEDVSGEDGEVRVDETGVDALDAEAPASARSKSVRSKQNTQHILHGLILILFFIRIIIELQ